MKFTYQPTPQLLAKRVILVTGATNGVGRHMAVTFARYGAQVILLGRNPIKLAKVSDEMVAAGLPEPALYPLDLLSATSDDYAELGSILAEEFGRLDGVLHNAAYFSALTPIEHTNVQDWYATLQVNLNAPFLLTQACLPLLRQALDARLVFTLCEHTSQARAYWGAYTASKIGLQSFAGVLAEELTTSSIKVNSIQPSLLQTTLFAKAYVTTPTQQSLTSLENLYLYVLGPDNEFEHGSIIYQNQYLACAEINA
ncbi:MAG: YciK family oxidoreductase [Gammaproteobacteria bacterium]